MSTKGYAFPCLLLIIMLKGAAVPASSAAVAGAPPVEQTGAAPYQSANWNWDYAPLLRVLPNGESLLAGGTNHPTGYNIVLEKRATNGAVLWSTQFESRPGFEDALPSHLVLDGTGNIYIAGFARCCDSGRGGLAVLKYNPDGLLLWSRFLTDPNVGHPRWAFVVDAQGNSVIGSAGAVFRYNHAGDLQWSFYHPRSAEAIPAEDFAVAVNDSGDTYLGTSVMWGGASVRVELRKFDSAGALQWTVPYAQLYRRYEIRALAVDAAGHLIAAGLGSPPEGPLHERQMFVQKYSPGGQKLWEKRFWEMQTGGSYGWNIIRIAVGPGDEITLLSTMFDYGFPSSSADVTRLGPDGHVRYRIIDPEFGVCPKEPLALDNFGNAYVTGVGQGAATAKYDAAGRRRWLVNYYTTPQQTHIGLAIGVDAAGDVRVLVKNDFDYLSEHILVHYRQRDATNTYRLRLIADPGGRFHLSVPTQEPVRIEASADCQTWNLLTEEETQRLLQPGATPIADSAKRFFRVLFAE